MKIMIDGHENYDFDTTTASMLSFSFNSKGYDVREFLCALS